MTVIYRRQTSEVITGHCDLNSRMKIHKSIIHREKTKDKPAAQKRYLVRRCCLVKMTNYAAFFSVALLVNGIVTFRSSGLWKKCRSHDSSSDEDVDPKEEARHLSLLKRYLIVYLLATLSDWLQGPYVYALYDAYGYSQHAIAVLFVAGFGSSMVFGSFVGGMADWGGRRRFVILFSITYAASCLTKRTYHIYRIYIL